MEDANRENLSPWGKEVVDLQPMMDGLTSVVASLVRQLSRQRDVDEWALRPLLQDTVVPRLNDVFRAKFVEIDRFHDLGTEAREIIHYTSLDMLVSVLRDKAEGKDSFVRMYDSFHLNDPEEGQYLVRHIEPIDQSAWLQEKRNLHAYVASFVVPDDNKDQELRDEDNLKYWLAYGQRGRGCSIRFPVGHDRFRRVLYGQEKATRTLERLDLSSIWNCLDPLIDNRNQVVSRVAEVLLSEVMRKNMARILYLYKDDAYKYEQECRAVKSVLEIDDEDIRFERLEQLASPQSLRHYYDDSDLSIDRILVTDSLITIGPLVARPDNVMYYITTLLERARLRGPKIRVSRIPYEEPLQ